MKYLSLGLPGGQNIVPPSSVPTGGITMVATIFRNSYTIFLILCVIFSLIYMVIGGMQWITSGGDKTKLEAARKRITYAIIGLIVALMSFLIVNILGYLFGVKLLNIGG